MLPGVAVNVAHAASFASVDTVHGVGVEAGRENLNLD